MSKWTQIARTGLHTSMSGEQVNMTGEYLDRIATSYAPKTHEAPLVLGHPKDNGPAFGWVQGLKREGEYLLAQFAQVPDSVKEAVDNGHYKKVSMSLYPDGTLRHVGLLGATPPAIKGLGDINLGTGDEATEIVFDFSETPEDPAQPTPEPSGTENVMDDKERIKQLEAEKAQLEKDKAAATQAAADAAKAKEAAEKSFAESQAAKAKDARVAKVDALIKDGKMLPAEKDRVMAFAERLGNGSDDICFSEGEGKKPMEEHFFNWLESRNTHGLFEFSEPAQRGGNGNESVTISGLAAKF